MRRLVFVPIVYTEKDELVCRNAAVLKGLGTIQLELCNGKMGDIYAVGHKSRFYSGPADQSPLHRALEAELDMTERAG